MELAVHFAQPRPGHVSIDLGCADIGVAKQFLDNPQVGSVLQ